MQKERAHCGNKSCFSLLLIAFQILRLSINPCPDLSNQAIFEANDHTMVTVSFSFFFFFIIFFLFLIELASQSPWPQVEVYGFSVSLFHFEWMTSVNSKLTWRFSQAFQAYFRRLVRAQSM